VKEGKEKRKEGREELEGGGRRGREERKKR